MLGLCHCNIVILVQFAILCILLLYGCDASIKHDSMSVMSLSSVCSPSSVMTFHLLYYLCVVCPATRAEFSFLCALYFAAIMPKLGSLGDGSRVLYFWQGSTLALPQDCIQNSSENPCCIFSKHHACSSKPCYCSLVFNKYS